MSDDCEITVNINVLHDSSSDRIYSTPPGLRLEDDGDGDVKIVLQDPDREIIVSRAALLRGLVAIGGE